MVERARFFLCSHCSLPERQLVDSSAEWGNSDMSKISHSRPDKNVFHTYTCFPALCKLKCNFSSYLVRGVQNELQAELKYIARQLPESASQLKIMFPSFPSKLSLSLLEARSVFLVKSAIMEEKHP